MIADKDRRRLAELFGVAVADVPDDGDLEVLEMIGTRRPYAKAYRLSELEVMTEPAWAVENFIPSGLVVEHAKPKGGKTFYTLTAVICFAMGIEFYGLQTGGPGRVLYIAAEGGKRKTWERISNIAKSLGVDMEELEQRIEVVTWGVKVDEPAHVRDLLLLNPGKWDLIVVDTLARCMSGNEDATEDMNQAVAGMDHIRRETEALSVITLHHEPRKEARSRGSIALDAAADALIGIVREKDMVTVRVELLRDAAIPDRDTMTFKQDREGGGVLILVPDADGREGLEHTESRMWAVLERMYEDAGDKPVEQIDFFAELDCVEPPITKASTKEGRRSAYRRSIRRMVTAGSIELTGPDKRPLLRPLRPSDDFNDGA